MKKQMLTLLALIIFVSVTQTSFAQCWRDFSSKGYFVVAIKPDGTLWSWGSNSVSQVGDGTHIDRNLPTQISEATDWAKVSAGITYSLAIKTDGTLWAWGYNINGQLGNGSTNELTVPTQIGNSTDWADVDAGGYHTMALKTDGSLWVWGDGQFGNLGDGTSNNKFVPTRLGTDTDWKQISAGYAFSFAIKNDGSLWAWGNNYDGQLGDGTTVRKYSPVRIGAANNWKLVSAGIQFTAAIKTDGTLWTWGNNDQGQLGNGSSGTNVLVPTKIGTTTNWKEVMASSERLMALKTDGTLWGTGNNEFGALGDGTTTERHGLVQITSANNWSKVVPGVFHGTGLRTNGTILTWGYNYSGQLGDGTNSGRLSPVAISCPISSTRPAVVSPVNYCQGAAASALSASGIDLKWYTVATGGTASSVAPTPSTSTVGNVDYYVSQTIGGIESPRNKITVTIVSVPSSPVVSSPINYCQATTGTALSATGTDLKWYTSPTGGTGATTAPVPSTGSIGTSIYYVSQTNNVCESNRSAILVNVYAIPQAPTASSSFTFCLQETSGPLTAVGSNLKWYTLPTGGTGVVTAPVPSTTSVGTNSYYVSQTVNNCESDRTEIVVTISPSPASPTVNTPVNYCEGSPASQLTAAGSNLKWYNTSTGGTASVIPPIPSTIASGTTRYYVSQSVNGCEGSRTEITINVASSPIAIPGSTVSYCIGNAASQLTASGTDIKWYTTPSGGVASGVAPLPTTTTAGLTIYYVSQTVNNCESPRSVVIVNVLSIPPSPQVSSTVEYCQNAVATSLNAGGMNLLWYNSLAGGTGSTMAPTPATGAIGATQYYVSQTFNGCESNRSTVTVAITAAPSAPVVTSPVQFCVGSSSSPLSASGSNLQWYSPFNTCTGSAIAPLPSTSVVGTNSYFVSQLVNGCESAKSEIIVQVNQNASAPGVVSPVNLFVNSSATALTATGTNLLWYTAPTGGIGSNTAPIPSTSAAGTFNYYVSQTVGGCESPRALIQVRVTNDINVPSCFAKGGTYQVELSPSYTANATQYSWWVNGSIQSISPTNTATPQTTISVGQWYSGGQVCVGINYSQAPWYSSVCVSVDLCQSGAKITEPPVATVIEDNKDLVQLFPNPSTEEVVVQVSSPITEVEIKNTLGVTVYSTKEISGSKTIVWDASIASGMYILQYRTADGVQHQKSLQKQ